MHKNVYFYYFLVEITTGVGGGGTRLREAHTDIFSDMFYSNS